MVPETLPLLPQEHGHGRWVCRPPQLWSVGMLAGASIEASAGWWQGRPSAAAMATGGFGALLQASCSPWVTPSLLGWGHSARGLLRTVTRSRDVFQG